MKGIVLTIAIGVIFPLFIWYGTTTFMSDRPDYQDYCYTSTIQSLNSQIQSNCNGQTPYSEIQMKKGETTCPSIENWINQMTPQIPEDKQSLCKTLWEAYYSQSCGCSFKYQEANENYQQTKFIILTIIGIIAIVTGGLMFSFEGIGTGILGGGVITVITGAIPYWSYMGDIVKFTMLGLALIALIVVGIMVALKEREK